MRIEKLVSLAIIAVVAIGILSPSQSQAAISLWDQGGAKAGLTLEAGAGLFFNDNANFGAGRFSDGEKSVQWQEGYFKPILDLSYTAAQAGTFYGGLSFVATATTGDGDAGDFSNDDPEEIDSELGYIGWKSGQLLSFLGEDAVDISIGEQEFAIGDGFLIMDGAFDGEDGAYWLAPHRSFDKTAILRLNTAPVRADVFYLKADDDYDNTELHGFNLEYVDELGTLGASWMAVTDSDRGGFYENRKGMKVLSVRAQGTPLANIGQEELFLSFEYARQSQGDRLDVDAEGWYGEAGYTFSQSTWTPTLSYRYAFFSGDKDPSDDQYESFDPMFYGFSRGWGTHFMGEITGEYFLFNSNEKVHMVHLNLLPGEKLSIGALYYDFRLDRSNLFGVPVSDDKFADEVNLYADYALNDNLYISAVFAWATPGTAAKEYTGGNDDSMLFQVYAVLTF